MIEKLIQTVEDEPLYFELVTKSISDKEDEERIVEAFIATTDKDMTGDVITSDALDRAVDFLKNKFQTVLFNHNQDRPIGKILDVKVETLEDGRKALWVKIKISKQENEVWQKIKEGILSKFSFGAFVTKKPIYKDSNQQEVDYYLITDMIPFEVSLVSVPANPNAVALSYYVNKWLLETKQKAKFKITINKTDIDFRPWSQVDKIKIRNILAESGNRSAINEMYGIVRSYERMTDWKFPHHVLRQTGENSYEMVLSYTGLMAAYKAFRGARAKPNVSSEEKEQLRKHLLKHFRYLVAQEEYDEIPEGLTKDMLASIIEDLNNESIITYQEVVIDKNLTEEFEKENDIMEERQELQEEVIITKELETTQDDLQASKEIENEEVKEVISKEASEPTSELVLKEEDFFIKLKDLIKEAVREVFREMEEDDEDDEEDMECEEDKSLDKSPKAMLEVIEKLLTKVSGLEEKLNKLESVPVVKGLESEDRDTLSNLSVEEILNSSLYKNLELQDQINVLKIVFEPKLSEDDKIKQIKTILRKKS